MTVSRFQWLEQIPKSCSVALHGRRFQRSAADKPRRYMKTGTALIVGAATVAMTGCALLSQDA